MIKKKSKRKNLRCAYEACGSRMKYSNWIDKSVIPIIGAGALKPMRTSGEYTVTERNFNRVTKTLNITIDNKSKAVKIIDKLGKDLTAELLITLIEHIPKPKITNKEIVYRIPIHGFSNNYQYKDISMTRKVCTDEYNQWKANGDAMMKHLVKPSDFRKVDFNKKVHLDLHFKHVPKMDTTNLIKSAQDLIFRALGKDDKVVKSCSVTGENARSYADGYIIAKLRNL